MTYKKKNRKNIQTQRHRYTHTQKGLDIGKFPGKVVLSLKSG